MSRPIGTHCFNLNSHAEYLTNTSDAEITDCTFMTKLC